MVKRAFTLREIAIHFMKMVPYEDNSWKTVRNACTLLKQLEYIDQSGYGKEWDAPREYLDSVIEGKVGSKDGS